MTELEVAIDQYVGEVKWKGRASEAAAERVKRALAVRGIAQVAPIDMVLHCPECGVQHIDAPEETDPATWTAERYGNWNNPPHRSHLCHACGHIWRPADVCTNGVAAVKTQGKSDSPIVGRRT